MHLHYSFRKGHFRFFELHSAAVPRGIAARCGYKRTLPKWRSKSGSRLANLSSTWKITTTESRRRRQAHTGHRTTDRARTHGAGMMLMFWTIYQDRRCPSYLCPCAAISFDHSCCSSSCHVVPCSFDCSGLYLPPFFLLCSSRKPLWICWKGQPAHNVCAFARSSIVVVAVVGLLAHEVQHVQNSGCHRGRGNSLDRSTASLTTRDSG
jgi:hypothetical protein